MVQLSDDCFAFDGGLIPVDQALSAFAKIIEPVAEPVRVPLEQALNRYLAEELVAQVSVPPHDNSAVDGFAVYHADLSADAETRLPVVGTVAAGHPLSHGQGRGEAARIFTGAPMPVGTDGGPGPDTVMMQEDCRVEGEQVVIAPGIKLGANRRFAAEDVAAGDVILTPGRKLRPQEIGLAAAVGRTELAVRGPIRAAVFSTGDEVRDPGGAPEPGTIFDSNRFTLSALLRGLGCEVSDLGILPDDLDAIRAGLAAAAPDHDVVLTSGGVSAGGEDHVRAAVQALGNLHFWRLAIKPGRPVALGQIGRVPFIGLPGNPVAVMVTFLRIARPLILRLAGATRIEPNTFRVRSGFEYKKKKDRREYVRVRLETGADGVVSAHKFGRDGAGILSSMVGADGLVELSEDCLGVGLGDLVDYLPFSEVGL